jgi:hypothetical protein
MVRPTCPMCPTLCPRAHARARRKYARRTVSCGSRDQKTTAAFFGKSWGTWGWWGNVNNDGRNHAPQLYFLLRESWGTWGSNRNGRMSEATAMRTGERFPKLAKRSCCARGQIRTMVRIWRSGAVTANCPRGSATARPNVLPNWQNVRNADAGRSVDRHHGHRWFRKGTVRRLSPRTPADTSTMSVANPFARRSPPSTQCPGLLSCYCAASASRPRAALGGRHAPRGLPSREGTPPPGAAGPSPHRVPTRTRSSPKKHQLDLSKTDLTRLTHLTRDA